MTASSDPLRAQLVRFLDWHEAHVDFDRAIKNLPAQLRGQVPRGLAHSPWQLLEHLRLAQEDILDFCRNPKYAEKEWPDDYWPTRPEPPTADAWDASVASYRRDLEAMKQLAADPSIDLFARIPHGSGQTYIREVLLVVDHAAYHIGQIVVARQLLGAWPPND